MDSPVETTLEPGTVLQLGVRPEHLDQTEGIGLEATVEFVEVLGSTSYVHATLGDRGDDHRGAPVLPAPGRRQDQLAVQPYFSPTFQRGRSARSVIL